MNNTEETTKKSERVTNHYCKQLLLNICKERGLVSHHLDSYNYLMGEGIQQMLEKDFSLDRQYPTVDDVFEKTGVKEISARIEVCNVEIQKRYNHNEEPIYPNICYLTKETYGVDVFVDIRYSMKLIGEDDVVKEEKSGIIKKENIAIMPILVKSKLCHLYGMSVEQELLNGYDANDQGGYFIVKGTEWFISTQESIQNNELRIIEDPLNREVAKSDKSVIIDNRIAWRTNFISKFGDGFERSYSTEIILTNINELYIRLINPQNEEQKKIDESAAITSDKNKHIVIPFDIMFRIFGVNNDKEIVEIITETIENSNHKKMLTNMLEKIFSQEYYCRNFTEDDRDLKESYLEKRSELKMLELGKQIKLLLLAQEGLINNDDENSYTYIRLKTTGEEMNNIFRKIFSNCYMKELYNNMSTMAKSNPDLTNFDRFITSCFKKESNMNQALVSSINEGGEPISMGTKPIELNIESNEVSHRNYLSVVTDLRKVITSEAAKRVEEKGTGEASLRPRKVHPSYFGYICPIHCSENEKIGLSKELALGCFLSDNIKSDKLMEYLKNRFTIHQLEDNVKCNLNFRGFFGSVDGKAQEIQEEIIQDRRNGLFHPHVSTYIDGATNEVNIYTQSGRPIKLLIIVHYDNDGNKSINLTKEHIIKRLKIDDLLQENIMEYVSSSEIRNCYLCTSVEEFYDTIDNKSITYTHVDIEQSLFSLSSTIPPFANHSEPNRTSMVVNHVKQAAGPAHPNVLLNSAEEVLFNHNAEYPEVETIANYLVIPNGENVIIACMCLKYNQEDSLIFNEKSIENGLFLCTKLHIQKYETESNNRIEFPQESSEIEGISNINKNGFINVGSTVKRGDILFNLVTQNPETAESINSPEIYDKSIPAKIMFVDIEIMGSSKYVTIKYITSQQVMPGDKFSVRSGCKGVVSQIKADRDMPVDVENGLKPDIIYSACTPITREVIGELIEEMYAAESLVDLKSRDGSLFTEVDSDIINNIDLTRRTMRCGESGFIIKEKITLAPLFMERLDKLASSSIRVAVGCKKNPETEEFVAGAKEHGGVKNGYMEKDVDIASGAIAVYRDKVRDNSDGLYIEYCKKCGNEVQYNEPSLFKSKEDIEETLENCKNCGENEVVKVPSSFINIYFDELLESSFLGINKKFKDNELYYSDDNKF